MPLLRLMGAGAVVTGSDDDITRSGAVERRRGGRGAGRPGPRRARRAPTGRRARVPAAARRARPAGGAAAGAPLRRAPRGRGHRAAWRRPARPRSSTAAPRAWPALAAFGALPEDAARSSTRATSRAARAARARPRAAPTWWSATRTGGGASCPSSASQNLGATLRRERAAGRELRAHRARSPSAAATPRRWPRSTARATCARPSSGGLLEFPEHAPIAAFDGDLATVWAADRYLPARATRWIEIGFERPRDVPYVDLVPTRDWRGIEREVDVNGVRARARARASTASGWTPRTWTRCA